MLDPLFTAEDLVQSGFAATVIGRFLNKSPVGLTDVGARWGVSPIFRPFAAYCDVLAFEPDEVEATRIRALQDSTLWRMLTVKECALASERRVLKLNILRRPNNSSIYPVIPHYYDRYKLKGFELERQVEVQAVSLDDAIFVQADARRWGEIIKIDAQGAELDILKGAERTLMSQTQCVVCEASFFSVYEGAPLFAEVESFLRARGFRLYGLLDAQHRSTKQLNKKQFRGRERLMQADAVFFRDPLEPGSTLLSNTDGQRLVVIQIVSALMFGFFDFAIELVKAAEWSAVEKTDLIGVIQLLANGNTAGTAEAVLQLAKEIQECSGQPLLAIGRFVDENRDFHTYHDAQSMAAVDESGIMDAGSSSRKMTDTIVQPQFRAADRESGSEIFVSLHLASNNLQNIIGLLDNVEAKSANPASVEILIKIDEDDLMTQELLAHEAGRRKFALRTWVGPRGAGFSDLWKAYNELIKITSSSVYFVCLINDEVRFNQYGWDQSLRRYIGLFPDHIFRLRATQLKFRNYYDFWECGYAPDSYAFYTKRWLEIVGDWNPCEGPDSSQQFIAYYLGYANYPAFKQFNRDVPILDISFSGEGACKGLSEEQRQKRNTLNFRSWFTLVSHPIQEELFRRARLLQGNIIAAEYHDRDLEVMCDKTARIVIVRDHQTKEVVELLSYKISRTRLFFANLKRGFHYHYYAGGGQGAWNILPFSVVEFLVVYFPQFRRWLGPLLGNGSYWIMREISAMVAQTVRQRQPAILDHLISKFDQKHPEWRRAHVISDVMLQCFLKIAVICRGFQTFLSVRRTRGKLKSRKET